MLSNFIKWGFLAVAGVLAIQAYNWLQHWPLWAWAVLISAFVGVLAVTIDEVSTWWNVQRVKREFRRLPFGA